MLFRCLHPIGALANPPFSSSRKLYSPLRAPERDADRVRQGPFRFWGRV